MLAKNNRLNLKKDFLWVRSGSRIEDNYFKLFFKIADNDTPRVGIAIPSTKFKKAVLRNKVRRMISKAFELIYPNLQKGVNIVIIPRETILAIKNAEFSDILKECLQKRSLIES